jgi:hypothetical protein
MHSGTQVEMEIGKTLVCPHCEQPLLDYVVDSYPWEHCDPRPPMCKVFDAHTNSVRTYQPDAFDQA